MVYRFFTRLNERVARQCQQHCLLCRHRLTPSPQCFGLCYYCHQALPLLRQACRRCALPLKSNAELCGSCQQKPPAFDSCLCAATYESYITNLIHQLKHQHHGPSCRLLSDLLCNRLMQENSDRPDIVIAAPMYWLRNLKRDNNHSHLLAQRVCNQLDLNYQPRLLQQHRPSASQKGLNARERRRNLRGVFRTNETLDGLHIAVIDDVITTGSTMNEIARTLKQAGAERVDGWAVARTPKPGSY